MYSSKKLIGIWNNWKIENIPVLFTYSLKSLSPNNPPLLFNTRALLWNKVPLLRNKRSFYWKVPSRRANNLQNGIHGTRSSLRSFSFWNMVKLSWQWGYSVPTKIWSNIASPFLSKLYRITKPPLKEWWLVWLGLETTFIGHKGCHPFCEFPFWRCKGKHIIYNIQIFLQLFCRLGWKTLLILYFPRISNPFTVNP